jgi:hypothetical protein
MGLKVSGKTATGAAASVSGVVGLVVAAINWANSHLSATGTSICANGLSPGVVTAVATGLGVLTSAGVIILMFAPSISDRVNEKAGFEAAKRLSTVPPPPTTEIKP